MMSLISIKSENVFSRIQIKSSFNSIYKTLERLSSGLRINSASDDPAGLIISEQLRSQIASMSQQISNTDLAIAKYNTAESAVGGLRSMLTELRTLAIAAANEGGNDETSQAALASSANHLVQSFDRSVDTATFNGSNLIDGSEGSLAAIAHLADQGIDLSTAENAEQSIAAIDAAIAEVDSAQMDLGATVKYDLESTKRLLEVSHQNLVAAESQIRDADILTEYTNLIRNKIVFQVALSMMAHRPFNPMVIIGLFDD